MKTVEFAHSDLFARGTPDAAPRFTGLPKYNFIGGHADPVQIPREALAKAAEKVLMREGASLAVYNLAQGPLGYRALRDFLVEKLDRHRGMKITAEEVLITSGSGQGLALVNELLVEDGDTVLVEELSYSAMIRQIRSRGAKIVPIPLDDDGIKPEALAGILKDLRNRGVRPKYIYTIPTIQNPTGSILPLERRKQLIALAREYKVPIFEDECYADLIWAGHDVPPSLYCLDPEQVIHIGSFSKTLAPALRVGYMVATWNVLSRMVALKSDGGTGALDQMVVAEYFKDNFDTHLQALSKVLKEKHDAMVEALEKEFGTSVEIVPSKGGIFVWIRLPGIGDVTPLLAPAAKVGLVFNAGPEWTCDAAAGRSSMRLCFALPTKDEIREGVAQLAKVCFENTGVPPRSGNVERRRP